MKYFLWVCNLLFLFGCGRLSGLPEIRIVGLDTRIGEANKDSRIEKVNRWQTSKPPADPAAVELEGLTYVQMRDDWANKMPTSCWWCETLSVLITCCCWFINCNYLLNKICTQLYILHVHTVYLVQFFVTWLRLHGGQKFACASSPFLNQPVANHRNAGRWQSQMINLSQTGCSSHFVEQIFS